MSKTNNQDTLPNLSAGTEGETPPARKRAAKKTATKAAAKKTAVKKSAVKKVATTKTATKKAPSKAAVATTPDLPFITAKPARFAPVAEPTPAPAPRDEEPPRRIGRVPGGGPVVPAREPVDARRQPAPQPAAPTDIQQQAATTPQQHEAPSREGAPQQREGDGSPPRESRSKRRREKRKRRSGDRVEQGNGQAARQPHAHSHVHPLKHPQGRQRHDGGGPPQNAAPDPDDRRGIQLNGPKMEGDGILELAPKGFGFLRIPGKNFEQARDDIFVTPESIRKYNLRVGQWIHGLYQDGPRGPQLVEISKINDMTPAEAAKLPHFDELKAINPTRRISFETTPERFTTRVVDIMAPVGRGQRGLIVSPPRSGKTTLLLHMAEAIREKYDEVIHLMVVLVDERPEEVTEFRRALPGAEIYASSNDEQPRNHCRIAELAIERAKRLVEAGKDVFLLMDSITRLARAYNGGMNNRGRGTGSGGITIGALEIPRRLFAAARNTRGGGSLTILATALIQTNSRADEAIFMEFKGTGNMELVLDRKIAENYIYPAVDIFKSGTRREELLLPDHLLHKIHLIRRGLSGHRPAEAMERLLFFLKKFPNNPQMLMEIKG